MPYTQENRLLKIKTPLGADKLLLVSLTGREGISQLFNFQLDLVAENKTKVAFDKLLGQPITIEVVMPKKKSRFFNGICSRISQGLRDSTHTAYRMEMVPKLWLLSRKAQSRIFQQITVPDILKKVLAGVDASPQIQGTFEPRNYCAQYRETDFNFASRLMEEEGIYYFFKHADGSHQMVLSNTPQTHPDVPGPSTLTFERVIGGVREEDRVLGWEKVQELRSGKVTLWDHSFELPGNHLETDNEIQDAVQVGTVGHKLKVGGNDKFELYDYPGEYAQRFDGVDPGGGDRPADVQKIFQDNKRTVGIRMQQEALPSLVIVGSSNCRQLTSGHKFTLEKHFDADGPYVITTVGHSARITESAGSAGGDMIYQNSFTCIPLALPFRPPQTAIRPVVQGSQTAVVVGPKGEEIFTDKYGRVKVQFHWDREGKKNADSSCWIRVGTMWAGKQWGAIHIPRIGQEVIVDFLEGDPDQPIIVGSVYNAEMMPPYPLPDNKTQSGLKSRSSLKGGTANFNELRLEDKKGSEDIYFHAEKDFHRMVENDDDLKVEHDQTIEIKNDRTETVKEGNELVTIKKGNRTVILEMGNDKHQLKMGNREVLIDMGNDTLTLKMGNQTTKLNLGKSTTEAMQSIELKVGASSVLVDQMGVTIKGMTVKVQGTIQTDIKGLMTTVKGDAMLMAGGGITMIG